MRHELREGGLGDGHDAGGALHRQAAALGLGTFLESLQLRDARGVQGALAQLGIRSVRAWLALDERAPTTTTPAPAHTHALRSALPPRTLPLPARPRSLGRRA